MKQLSLVGAILGWLTLTAQAISFSDPRAASNTALDASTASESDHSPRVCTADRRVGAQHAAALRPRRSDDAARPDRSCARAPGAKRPGAHLKVLLDDRIGAAQPPAWELMMVDEALVELARIDPRQAQIVELRYFGGLSEREVAAVLSVSRATVTREWQTARAWLYRRLTTGRARGPS